MPRHESDRNSATDVSLQQTRQKLRSQLFYSAYDDLIENNRRRIALLEEAARLLYREWFVHFRFPGHEHVKFIDGIPEGWDAADSWLIFHKLTATAHRAKELPENLNYIDISSVAQGTEFLSIKA